METRPRILQVCAVDFTVYHFLLPLMRAQREWGFDVEVACTPGEFRNEIEAEGFTLHLLPIERSVNPLEHFSSYLELRDLLKKRPFIAVHAHTPVAALIARPAARRSRVPVVVYTAHGFYFHDAMAPLLRRVHVGLERWAQRYADYLLTQSAEDCETALREEIAPAGRALAIGNGVDVKRFSPSLLSGEEKAAVRKSLGVEDSSTPLVTMMGRLVREKGYFDCVEAWATVHRMFPEAKALLIGEALQSDRDNPEPKLRERIRELRLSDSIILAGLRRDVPRLLAASDLFVLPSWREGMPRSILEAMASGLPVVATDIRGCREEVQNGKTGKLVPVKNPEALATAISELLANPVLRQRMSYAARERAEREFDEQLVIERQKKVFQQLFREKGLPWP